MGWCHHSFCVPGSATPTCDLAFCRFRVNGLVRPPSVTSHVCVIGARLLLETWLSGSPVRVGWCDHPQAFFFLPVKRGFFLPGWIGHWFPSVCAVWFDQHCMFLGVRLLSGNLLWVGPRLEVRCEPAGLTSRECVLTGV